MYGFFLFSLSYCANFKIDIIISEKIKRFINGHEACLVVRHWNYNNQCMVASASNGSSRPVAWIERWTNKWTTSQAMTDAPGLLSWILLASMLDLDRLDFAVSS